MNAAITIIAIISLGCFSNCYQNKYCTNYDLAITINDSCKSQVENQGLGCKLICRELNNSIELFFNSGKSDSNITPSGRQTITDVEITLSHLLAINATYMENFETIEKLNLSYNELNTIASDTFHNLTILVSLDLSHNNLSNVPDDLLRNLIGLKYLDLAANKIWYMNSSCLRDLEMLSIFNISRNSLTEIPEDLFSNTPKLKVLLLAHNKLRTLSDVIFCNLTHLEILDLSNNQLSRLQPQLFESLKNLHNLSVSYNQIKTLEKKVFEHTRKTLIYIDLLGNPWNCNESHYWLYLWLQESPNSFASARELSCHDLKRKMNRTFIDELEVINMAKSIQECETCKICKCEQEYLWMVVVVNCSNRNLTSLPQKLPYRTRRIVLDNNKITSLVVKDENIPHWTNVSFLGLNNNLISSLQPLEKLELLRRVLVLNISGNKLQEIPLRFLDQFNNAIHELRLANNPWICNCNTIRFQMWLQDHYHHVKDIKEIKCATDDTYTSNQVIYTMMKSELCPQPPKSLDYLDILNVTMGLLILLIISKVTYDYWHQKKTGKLPRFFGFNLP